VTSLGAGSVWIWPTDEPSIFQEIRDFEEGLVMSVASNNSSTHASTDGSSRERVISQMLFREVNERMRRLHIELEHEGDLQLICECRNRGCLEPLSLSTASYDAIRRIPTHFIVKAGHEMPDGERVAAAFDGYVITEKTGQDARTAVRFDPRKRSPDRENVPA
jgi:hypothetical protein